MHRMDSDELMVAKAIVNDVLEGDDDIVVSELSGAKMTVHRKPPPHEHMFRARVVVGKHGAVEIDSYDVEIIVRRRAT